MFKYLARTITTFIILVYCIVPSAQGKGLGKVAGDAIKASMLNGLIGYTNWPKQVPGSSFVVGIIGQHREFSTELRRIFQKKPLSYGRKLKIRKITLDSLLECDVIVLLGDANRQAGKVISSVTGLPILTVSDQVNFTSLGGHVNFFKDNDKLRFQINWQSTTSSKLKISSRLLRVAKVVSKH